MRSDPVLVDPAPSLRPSMWNLCDLALELAAGPSVQRGRKSEKSGDIACAGSEELYSCRNPDEVRTQYDSRYARVNRFLRSRWPVCTAMTDGSCLLG